MELGWFRARWGRTAQERRSLSEFPSPVLLALALALNREANSLAVLRFSFLETLYRYLSVIYQVLRSDLDTEMVETDVLVLGHFPPD